MSNSAENHGRFLLEEQSGVQNLDCGLPLGNSVFIMDVIGFKLRKSYMVSITF